MGTGPLRHSFMKRPLNWACLATQRSRGVHALMILFCVLGAACGARQDVSTAARRADQSPAPPASPREEFEGIAKELRDSVNPYYGMKQIEELRARVAAVAENPVEEVTELIRLSAQLTRVGETEEATEVIDRALRTAEATPALAERIPAIHYYRGIAYLRLSELKNCISNHNGECCLFPLQGDGVHDDRLPAEEARKSFNIYLTMRPDDAIIHWVMNILAMALGDYPLAVPETYRILPESFLSDYDIGHFPDIAAALGVDVLNLAGGSSVEDFTGDGLLDIFATTWDVDGPAIFFRNMGDGTFADESASSGAADQLGGLNCIAGDYDNDGDSDVLILRGAWTFRDGRIRNSLLENNGDGTFTDVTYAAGLAKPAYPTQTAAWGDFDNDGDLDLFVGNEADVDLYADNSALQQASRQENYPNQFFRNNGDGTFTDVAQRAGVVDEGFCKGVAAGDYDNDGDLDVYVSNLDGRNRLYRNNGGWNFEDVSRVAGVTEPSGRSFACWFFDYDNDTNLDLFVAAYSASNADALAASRGEPHHAELPCLYRNNGDGTFTDVARDMGLVDPYSPMGANFGDLDNDGYLDIFLTTGDPDFRSLVPNAMLRNDKGQTFQNVTTAGGFGNLQKGHGVSFGDMDNDGDQDIYHAQGGAFPSDKYLNAFYLNPGHGNHYLVVALTGERSTRSAVGARITVLVDSPGGERTLHRAVGIGSSFGGSPLRQEIGLGDATGIRELRVDWPASATHQIFSDVPMDAMIRIRESADTLERVPYEAIPIALTAGLGQSP